MSAPVTSDRVTVYIDGFNLYHGMKASGFRHLLWLNLEALAQELLQTGQTLVDVKYFTARATGPLALDTPDEAKARLDRRARQNTYLKALKQTTKIKIIQGRYDSSEKTCDHCAAPYYRLEEKKTDVAIATHLICDAIEDQYDVAIFVSGDSDLVPAVQAVRRLRPEKKIVAAFPPDRQTKELMRECHGYTNIGRTTLAKCQLPSPIKDRKGQNLIRPLKWIKGYHAPPRNQPSRSDATFRMQQWFAANCANGWPDKYGITITTLADPGWQIEVNLEETNLHGRSYYPIVEGIDASHRPNQDAWMHCRLDGTDWVGSCDPKQLLRLCSAFLCWAEYAEKTS